MGRDLEKHPNPFPIEQKLIDILSDGLPHSVEQLKLCLTDGEYSSIDSLYVQIVNLRKVLKSRGRDVRPQRIDGVSHYRMVRFLNDEE